MLFVLLVLCAAKPLLTGGFSYKWSTVLNFVVWLLVGRWCLIKCFRIAGPLCRVSICSSQKKRSFDVFFHVCPNELLNKQWICKWVEDLWNSCCCSVICHSVFNDITVPVCGETTGHLLIPAARDHLNGALCGLCAAIPSLVDFPHKR